MSLVPLLDAQQAPLPAQEYYADGDPGPIVAALAHVPEVLEVTLPFLGVVLGPSALSLRTKEIVILRTSADLACRYCVDTHTVVARDADLSVDEVRALRGEAEVAPAFPDPADRALIGWVDAVALGPGTPPPDVAAAVSAHFGEAALVELTLLAGTTLLLNRFATSLGLPTSPETLRRLGEEGWR
jgi:AhpD family alkylhydroperoxidase